jgi:DHA1 family bicyclomycin/chloramphenicol resistance-like MFS transporter
MPIPKGSFAFTLMLGALSALPPLGIDMSLPALPLIASALHTSAAAAGATLSIFLLGFATAPLLFGPLSDRYGRRPILLGGVAVYAMAGLACAAAPSIGWVLLGRLLQGMGAGVGTAMPLAIVRDLFEGHAARTRLSYVTVILSVAPLIAPALGSSVLLFAGWRGIYFALAVASTGILVLSALGFAESKPPGTRQGVRPGQLLARYRWVLGNRTTVGFSVVNGLTFACMFAFISGAPLVLIGGRGFSALAFSAVFTCTGCGTIGGAFLNGWLSKRGVASTRVLVGGLALGATSATVLMLLSVTGHDAIGLLLPLLFLTNATYGLVGPNAAHEALLPMGEAAGAASAVLRSIQMVAGAAASAVVPLLFDGHSSIAMTGVMFAFAASALLVYVLGPRRTALVGAVAAE